MALRCVPRASRRTLPTTLLDAKRRSVIPTAQRAIRPTASQLRNTTPFSRVTKDIPPDGTGSGNNASTSYSGNSVTVTDQAGKQRRSFTDALGRLIEVDEPTGGSPATPGAGSATEAGSEQSIGGA